MGRCSTNYYRTGRNNDIELQTPIEYVIGYICRNLSSTEHIGKSLEKNKLYENEEDCKIHTRNPTFRPSPCWVAKIKKHRNQLIYGALNDFLKTFMKPFVFVSAERQVSELVSLFSLYISVITSR